MIHRHITGNLLQALADTPAVLVNGDLEAGGSIGDFLEGFPSVRREQVIAVLEESRRELLQPA